MNRFDRPGISMGKGKQAHCGIPVIGGSRSHRVLHGRGRPRLALGLVIGTSVGGQVVEPLLRVSKVFLGGSLLGFRFKTVTG